MGSAVPAARQALRRKTAGEFDLGLFAQRLDLVDEDYETASMVVDSVMRPWMRAA